MPIRHLHRPHWPKVCRSEPEKASASGAVQGTSWSAMRLSFQGWATHRWRTSASLQAMVWQRSLSLRYRSWSYLDGVVAEGLLMGCNGHQQACVSLRQLPRRASSKSVGPLLRRLKLAEPTCWRYPAEAMTGQSNRIVRTTSDVGSCNRHQGDMKSRRRC